MSEEVRNDAATGAETGEQQVNSLFAQRLAKVRELEAAGIDPYGHAFPNTVPIEQVRAEFVAPAEGEYGPEVTVAGRLSQNTWETKEGQKRSKLEVIGEDIDFQGGKRTGQAAEDQPADVYDDDCPF